MDVIFLKNLMKYHPCDNFVVVFHNDIGYHELIINFGIVMTLPQSFNLSEFPVRDKYYMNRKIKFLAKNLHKKCVIIHSSWIRSNAANVYQFREDAFYKADDKTYFSIQTGK